MLHPYLRQQGGVDRAERIGGEDIYENNSPLFCRQNFPLSFPERGPVWREQQVFQQQSFILILNQKTKNRACGMLHPSLRQQGGVGKAKRIGGELKRKC